ncbi:hypothetical protein HPP92_008031 [Vanilla planifolia]|uniref:TPX2 C-terminal domain-containing protein n=1 Tax=Vanilla planifolia TaxID=51239 RepID=A0A835V9Z7_VANPL|nr:hypothetical protein HPP92_008046 [Vanilla planifolia]KAG0491168.1 hypothetical protein HPP92_008031 [Vanilla planifolia]
MEDPSSFSSPKGKEPAFVGKVQEEFSDDTKDRISLMQASPLTAEKPQKLPYPKAKESKKPPSFRLHTQERAARRAGFNHLVASKISTLEVLRRFEEKIQKVIEEEEIKMMRKEMVPKAQLMPIFDRPFLPQRSTRPPTIPKEPNFHFAHNLKAIR